MSPAELYRDARLASALDWRAEQLTELNELERQFLDASRDADAASSGWPGSARGGYACWRSCWRPCSSRRSYRRCSPSARRGAPTTSASSLGSGSDGSGGREGGRSARSRLLLPRGLQDGADGGGAQRACHRDAAKRTRSGCFQWPAVRADPVLRSAETAGRWRRWTGTARSDFETAPRAGAPGALEGTQSPSARTARPSSSVAKMDAVPSGTSGAVAAVTEGVDAGVGPIGAV